MYQHTPCEMKVADVQFVLTFNQIQVTYLTPEVPVRDVTKYVNYHQGSN